MFTSVRVKFFAVLAVCMSVLFVGGCAATAPRSEYSIPISTAASIPDIADARIWADDPKITRGGLWSPTALTDKTTPVNMLSLSGGGAEGAFGAGFLAGWTKTGNRPKFSVVSGTSAGALLAPFAFLGPNYDPVLQQIFTQEKTSDLVRVAGLSAVFGSSVFSDEPLNKIVAHYVTPELVNQVALEHAKGRRLYVITTNIDTQRTAIWNMGAIASARTPEALQLFRKVLVASASVPGILPPQEITVRYNGREFKEMHLDGGVTANIMLLPESILQSGRHSKMATTPTLYLLFNGKIDHEYKLVRPRTLSVLERSFGTSIKAGSRQSFIAAQQFARAQGWEIRMTALRADYESPVHEIKLDEQELTALFNEGARSGSQPGAWRKEF